MIRSNTLLKKACQSGLLFAISLLSFVQMSQAQVEATDFSDIDVIVKNETAINSDAFEFSPAFYENGIVFISSRVASSKYEIKDKNIGTNIMAIFIARRNEDGELQEPTPFAEALLSKTHEGPLTFNRTNDKIFFTRNNLNAKGKPVKAKDGKVKLKIYSAVGGGSSWGSINELPFNSDQSNAAHPSISVDGDKIFFSSDREGGFGGMDLYVSYRNGESWGEPINLGPDINTAENEVFPYIHADGTLYFSTKAYGGKGGLDIFYTTEENGSWAYPTNFEPLNTSKDDFGLILDRDKKNGYLSSNGRGGIGEDDIYSFRIIGDLDRIKDKDNLAQAFKVLVEDMDTGEPINGAVIQSLLLDEFTIAKAITNSDGAASDEILLNVPFDESSTLGTTDVYGEYPINLETGYHIMKVQKEGFQTKRITYNTDQAGEDGERIIIVKLKPGSDEEVLEAPDFTTGGNSGFPSRIEEGTVFRLPNIYYNFNDAAIRPDAQVDLDYLADFLLKFPDIVIELASHTDARGGAAYNQQLSQRRAENAVDYLVRKGVSRNRLTPAGFGETQLINGCSDGIACTEAQHQYNRRTDVRILKMDGPIDLTIVNERQEPEVIDYPGGRSTGVSSTSNTNYDAQGSFQVIAGVFGVFDNAQTRLDKLTSMGYREARILYNENRGLHAVIVRETTSRADANSTKSQLAAEGIESYVK